MWIFYFVRNAGSLNSCYLKLSIDKKQGRYRAVILRLMNTKAINV